MSWISLIAVSVLYSLMNFSFPNQVLLQMTLLIELTIFLMLSSVMEPLTLNRTAANLSPRT